MRCRQVRKAIDIQPLDHADGNARLAILAHCEKCIECRQWLEAAALTTSLIRARAAEEMEASPLFRTRVLGAIRDCGADPIRRQTEGSWRASRAIRAHLVSD